MTQTITAETRLKSMLTDLAVYNHWANTTFVEWLKKIPTELMTREVPSSFTTLQKTLMHIWDVEQGWLARMQGVPTKSYTWQGFDGTLKDIFENIQECSQNFVDFIQSLDEDELVESCYFNIKYVGEHTVPRAEIIQHSLTHSCYHRGQVVTMARNLGITEIPMNDYMCYVLRIKNA